MVLATKARLTRPAIALAPTPEDVTRLGKRSLARAHALLSDILAVRGRRTLGNTLLPYDEILRGVLEAAMQGELVFNTHPDAAVREAGDRVHQEAMSFLNELNLNRELYDAIRSIRLPKADRETRHAVAKILRDFRRAGVDKDEATRATIKALNDEITAIGAAFDRNINEDLRSIQIEDPEKLAGLPEDYIAAHPPKEGRITITTAYPDALPVLQYARDPELRRRLQGEFLNRGYPKNLEVLSQLLAKRHELARLLGYKDYADYVTEDKMIGSAEAAAEFIEKVSKAAEARMRRDYEVLVERKRKDATGARGLDPWDVNYYMERVRAERFAFDSQEARPYFPFERVRDGLFELTAKLFGVRYRRVARAPVWHESVEVYDVYDRDVRLGRFYLDLHPREGKFSHAAAFPLVIGLRSRQLSQAALVCNFPDPRRTAGPALMEHSEVVTFFHEFGHLLHAIFSGRAKWVKTSMEGIEWDFVEAPSQMLEEWARRPEGLRTFARHHATGEPIPQELVERMERAQSVGRGLQIRRQIFFAALSLAYYRSDPSQLDTTALARQLNQIYYPVPWYDGTHFQCNFGHLNGYSAVYYTYMWSLVIAKDLFSAFLKRESIMDPAQARKYRRTILEPGSSQPAARLVRTFLGRGTSFDAFKAWLEEGSAPLLRRS